MALDDLFTSADGRVVALLDYVSGRELTDLLRQAAGRLEVGEAITVLAPLLQAIAAGHERGLTGVPLALSTIRFTATGAPVLISVNGARLTPPLPSHYWAGEEEYRADRRALGVLAQQVVRAVHRQEAAALEATLVAAGPEPDPALLAAALFELARPIPIRPEERAPAEVLIAGVQTPSAPTTGDDDLILSAEARNSAPTVDPADAPTVGTTALLIVGTLRSLGLPDSVVEAVERGYAVATRGITTCRAWASRWGDHREVGARRVIGIRPRSVVVGVAGVGALVLAVSLGMTAPDRAGSTEAPVVDAPVSMAPMASLAVSNAPEHLIHPEPDEWGLVVDELLRRWLACRATAGAPSPAPESTSAHTQPHAQDDTSEAVSGRLCDAAVHSGSAAQALLTADDSRHDVIARWVLAGGSAVVVERMGGAVLIDLVTSSDGAPDGSEQSAVAATSSPPPETTVASLLVVRSEAGWRVRDVRL